MVTFVQSYSYNRPFDGSHDVGVALSENEFGTPAIDNLWGIVKRKIRNKRPKNADELKDTVNEIWASIPPQQCHKLITSMPR